MSILLRKDGKLMRRRGQLATTNCQAECCEAGVCVCQLQPDATIEAECCECCICDGAAVTIHYHKQTIYRNNETGPLGEVPAPSCNFSCDAEVDEGTQYDQHTQFGEEEWTAELEFAECVAPTGIPEEGLVAKFTGPYPENGSVVNECDYGSKVSIYGWSECCSSPGEPPPDDPELPLLNEVNAHFNGSCWFFYNTRNIVEPSEDCTTLGCLASQVNSTFGCNWLQGDEDFHCLESGQPLVESCNADVTYVCDTGCEIEFDNAFHKSRYRNILVVEITPSGMDCPPP